MRYTLTKEIDDIFTENHALTLVNEFNVLKPGEMYFVMLFADYLSPFRHLIEEDGSEFGEMRMRRECAVASGFTDGQSRNLTKEGMALVTGKNRMVERAIEAYRSQQGVDALMLISMLETSIRDFIRDMSDGVLEKSKSMPSLINIAKSNIISMLVKERNDIILMNREFRKKMKESSAAEGVEPHSFDMGPESEDEEEIPFDPDE